MPSLCVELKLNPLKYLSLRLLGCSATLCVLILTFGREEVVRRVALEEQTQQNEWPGWF